MKEEETGASVSGCIEGGKENNKMAMTSEKTIESAR